MMPLGHDATKGNHRHQQATPDNGQQGTFCHGSDSIPLLGPGIQSTQILDALDQLP